MTAKGKGEGKSLRLVTSSALQYCRQIGRRSPASSNFAYIPPIIIIKQFTSQIVKL